MRLGNSTAHPSDLPIPPNLLHPVESCYRGIRSASHLQGNGEPSPELDRLCPFRKSDILHNIQMLSYTFEWRGGSVTEGEGDSSLFSESLAAERDRESFQRLIVGLEIGLGLAPSYRSVGTWALAAPLSGKLSLDIAPNQTQGDRSALNTSGNHLDALRPGSQDCAVLQGRKPMFHLGLDPRCGDLREYGCPLI